MIEKWLTAFYNRIAGKEADSFADLPESAKVFLLSMRYVEAVRPFIIEDLEAGRSVGRVVKKYGVTFHFARMVGASIGQKADPQKHKRRISAHVSTFAPPIL